MFEGLKKFIKKLSNKKENSIDYRDIDIELYDSIDSLSENNKKIHTHAIISTKNGEEVAHLVFAEVNDNDNYLYLTDVHVDTEYIDSNLGINSYSEFLDIYSSSYKGWEVRANLENDASLNNFKKALKLKGMSSFDEIEEERTDSEDEQEIVQMMRNSSKKILRTRVLRNSISSKKYKKRMEGLKVINQCDLRKSATTSKDVIDLRNLTFENSVKNYGEEISNYIEVIANGKQLGYLLFLVSEEEEMIYDIEIFINDQYQKLGVGTALYEEFGKVYETNYNGYIVKRFFVNPVAEYSFRKAVSLGLVPQSMLSEDNIMRDYYLENNKKIRDLRNKLPENVRGPEVWAKDMRRTKVADLRKIERRDLRMNKEALILDLRTKLGPNVTDMRRGLEPNVIDMRRKLDPRAIDMRPQYTYDSLEEYQKLKSIDRESNRILNRIRTHV